jgi:LacI family transcriptional regulator
MRRLKEALLLTGLSHPDDHATGNAATTADRAADRAADHPGDRAAGDHATGNAAPTADRAGDHATGNAAPTTDRAGDRAAGNAAPTADQAGPSKPATVRDVARRAGVSTATVSRALDPAAAGLVAPETRARVASAAAELGWAANPVARSLKTRATRTVAVVAPEFANDFFMELAESMEAALEAEGYTLVVASSSNAPEAEAARLARLSDRMVDGLVVIPAGGAGGAGRLDLPAARGVPVVLVDRLVEGAGCDAVLSDNSGGARALAEALLADGYRRLAFIGGAEGVSTARERLAGFLEAADAAGLAAADRLVLSGGMGIADGYRLAGELLALGDPPDGLVAVNLLVHLGVQRRLLEAGPAAARFALAGFDDTPYSPFLPACRYTAAQDAAGLGLAAVRRLLARIADARAGRPARPPEIIRLPVRLVRRGPAQYTLGGSAWPTAHP